YGWRRRRRSSRRWPARPVGRWGPVVSARWKSSQTFPSRVQLSVVVVAVAIGGGLRSRRVGGGRRRLPPGRGRGDGELGGADLPFVLEVQEQSVGTGRGGGGAEGDLRAGFGGAVAGLALGVDVQVGQVTRAQRDQVPIGAQVGLEVGDRLAVLGHAQGQVAFLARR